MRLTILLIAIISSLAVNAQSEKSLKVTIEGGNVFVYPPNTKFEIKDGNGKLIYNQKDLTKDMIIDIEKGEELTVFTSWAEGKDVFTPESANISLLQAVEKEGQSEEDLKFWEIGRPKIVSESYTANDEGEFDAKVEFEGQIQFSYENGEVKISERGQELELLGKYVAKTDEGLLKLSYHPENKKLYYIFSENVNEPLVIIK